MEGYGECETRHGNRIDHDELEGWHKNNIEQIGCVEESTKTLIDALLLLCTK